MNFKTPGDFTVWLAQQHGFSVHMARFLPPWRKQSTTEEANESRMVTKIRHIVEVVNGRVKRGYKFFLHVIENTYRPIVGDIFKIACSLVNAFSPPLSKPKSEDEELPRIMLERRDKRRTNFEQDRGFKCP
jgi:hypothetical protein